MMSIPAHRHAGSCSFVIVHLSLTIVGSCAPGGDAALRLKFGPPSFRAACLSLSFGRSE